MLTIFLLAVATTATGTCAHLGFVNLRLRRINRELKRRSTQAGRVNRELKRRSTQAGRVNDVLRSRIKVLRSESNLHDRIIEFLKQLSHS